MRLGHRLATGLAAALLVLGTLGLLDASREALPGRASRGQAPAGAEGPVAGLLLLLGMEAAEGRPPAADFTLPLLGGGHLRLADLRGRVVLLNFWATWCPPCRAEMPAMERLYRELAPRGFTIVAVDYQEGEGLIGPFVRELGLTFPIALDRDGVVMDELYPSPGLPTSYLLDRGGRVVARKIGYVEWESAPARALIDALLEEGAPGSPASGRSALSSGR